MVDIDITIRYRMLKGDTIMKFKYPECLEDIGLRVIGKFTIARDHTDIECKLCGNIFNATPKSKMQNYKKWGIKGCPDCTRDARYAPINESNTQRLIDMGYKLLSDYNGLKQDIKVINTNCTCGRAWVTRPDRIFTGRSFCKPCNDDNKRERLRLANLRRSKNALSRLSGFIRYRSEVRVLSERVYRDNEAVLTKNYTLTRGRNECHLDHIISISYCYKNNIPTEVCSDVTNLQLIDEVDNISKGKMVTTRIPDIFRKYIPSVDILSNFMKGVRDYIDLDPNQWESFGKYDAPLYFPTKNLALFFITFDMFTEQNVKNKLTLKSIRQELMSEYNVRSIFVYESEWVRSPQLVLNKLRHILGESSLPSIYARKCVVREVTPDDKSKFLDLNHIQGNDRSNIRLGLYYCEELVAVMTFTRPKIFMKGKVPPGDRVYELSRYATSESHRIVGGFTKLLAYALKSYSITKIVSFADLRWSDGGIYSGAGFTLAKEIPPDYAYIIDGSPKHRWGYRKDRIKEMYPDIYDPERTEYSMMLELGCDRLWDAGKLRYELLP